MIGSGLFKKFRNLFHVPGEDIIIIGFDDRCKSIRKYQMWSKQANRFSNLIEGKTIEGNVAEPLISYPDKVITTPPSTLSSILEKIQEKIPIGKRFVPVPEPEVIHSVDDKGVYTFQINPKYGHIFKTDDIPEGIAYLADMQTGQGGQLIPKQMRVERDPVLDFLFSVNPFFFGSIVDSFSATELLRGKVEWWKTFLFMGFALVLGLIIGAGM
jgi:hypothetical protein